MQFWISSLHITILNYPKSIKISKNRVCWFIWEINQWIEAKLASR
ncbi:AlpA family phage regulatory protein [Acinetobacter soli]